MRQLTYVGGNTIEWWDVPEPKLQDDRDALVRPLAVTRCDLDLIIAGGKSGLPGPFALGHETAGVVTEVGDGVKNFTPGDLVIVPFQISCGECERCRRGHTNACTSVPFRSSYGLKPVCGVEYGGALSDLIRVPFADHMLVKQPAGHALSQTAGLADGATDGFSGVAHRLRERPGAEVLVIGGFGQSLSMFAVQAALSRGARRVVKVWRWIQSDSSRSWSMPPRLTPASCSRSAPPSRMAFASACMAISPRPRRCRCGICMASASRCGSGGSMCAPKCLIASPMSPPVISTRSTSSPGGFVSKTLMRRSAIRQSGSPSFAMELND
jgi:hypothetical protein